MLKLLFLPIRIVLGLLKFSGVKGALLLVIGVGIGLLIAPKAGAELRAKLQQRLEDQRAG